MFDNFLIRKDSLQNVYNNQNEVIGFKFAVRQDDYRGHFLSLHNGYYLTCDGVEYPVEVQSLEINGKPPRSLEETKAAVWEHWDYDDEAYVYVQKLDGLTTGKHTVGLLPSTLAQYGYWPHDEEWVKNPPKPGKGGFGKTSVVCTYDLELV